MRGWKMCVLPVYCWGKRGGGKSWVEEERESASSAQLVKKLVCMRRMWRNDASRVREMLTEGKGK